MSIASPPTPPPGAVAFHAPVAPVVRSSGRILIGAAVLLALAVALRLTGAGAGAARTASDVLVTVAVLAALVAALRAAAVAAGRGPRLVLTADGFVNRTRAPLTGRGELRAASWVDIRSVQAITDGGRRLLVLTAADGGRSVVQLRRLAAAPAVIESQIQDRLDAANGYRSFGILTAPPGAPRPGGQPTR